MDLEPQARTTGLAEVGRTLMLLAGELAELAEREAAPFLGPLRASEVSALLKARQARAALFPLPLADPHWTLLLELLRAHLDNRPLRWKPLAAEPVLDRLCAAGLARRHRDTAVLTDYAAQALHRQLQTEKLALLLG